MLLQRRTQSLRATLARHGHNAGTRAHWARWCVTIARVTCVARHGTARAGYSRRPTVAADAGGAPQLGLSINQQLQNLFHILTFERSRDPSKLGGSVFGMDDVYRKLRTFASRFAGQDRPPLYFVSVDVKDCFDSVKHAKLFGIIAAALEEDEYLVRRYTSIIAASGTIKRNFKRFVSGSGELVQFVDFAKELAAGVLRGAVLTDQVVCHFEEKGKLLELLRQHIFSNIVKVGKPAAGRPRLTGLNTALTTQPPCFAQRASVAQLDR